MNHVIRQHLQPFVSGTYSDADADSQSSFSYWDHIDFIGELINSTVSGPESLQTLHPLGRCLACLTGQHRAYNQVKLKMLFCMQASYRRTRRETVKNLSKVLKNHYLKCGWAARLFFSFWGQIGREMNKYYLFYLQAGFLTPQKWGGKKKKIKGKWVTSTALAWR